MWSLEKIAEIAIFFSAVYYLISFSCLFGWLGIVLIVLLVFAGIIVRSNVCAKEEWFH